MSSHARPSTRGSVIRGTTMNRIRSLCSPIRSHRGCVICVMGFPLRIDPSIWVKEMGVFSSIVRAPRVSTRDLCMRQRVHPESIRALVWCPFPVTGCSNVTGMRNGWIGPLTIGSVVSSASSSVSVPSGTLATPGGNSSADRPALPVNCDGAAALECSAGCGAPPLESRRVPGGRGVDDRRGGNGQSTARCPSWSHL